MKRISLLVTSLLILIGNLFSQTCPDGLISYWKLDELSGLNHADHFAAHHATSNNEIVADEQGIVGAARILNTTSAYVGDKAVIPNNAAYNIGANASFSIVYWVKLSELNYNAEDHIVISKGDWVSGNPNAPFWASGVNGSAKFNFLLHDSNGNHLELETPSGDYANESWHQIALVVDNVANISYIYIDGTQQASGIKDFTGNFINTNDIQLGNLLSSGVYHYYFKGALDEVAIYSKALTPAEIQLQRTRALSGMGICDGSNAVISSVPNKTATVGLPYAYKVRAGGEQAQMTYSLVTAPTGMTIDPVTGLIAWTPTAITQNGLVKVRAYNNYPPADTQTFRINLALGTPCPANLTLLLKLNETAGTSYADYYNEHNATATVSPTAITGKIHGAQSFNTTTKINIPDNDTEFEWTSTSSFSFECWMKPSNVVNTGMVALGRINIFEGAEYSSWQLGVTSTGYANFELWDNHGTGTILNSTTVLDDGNWHHVVAVRDGATNTNKLYVDGELEDSEVISYGVTFKSDVQPNDINLGYIKRASGSANEYHFQGGLDEVAIFSVALTDANVTQFYNNGSPVGHCSEGNFAPVITSEPKTSGSEDVAYSYTFTVDDFDATDTLTLSAVTKPSWLSFNWTPGQKTATLSGTPNSTQVGNHTITLRVTDNHVPISQTYTLNIINVNTDPVVTSTPVTQTNEDAVYTYTLTVTDEDAADVISMNAAVKPAWLNFNYTAGSKTATLTGTPDDANIGTGNVDITISDGHQTLHHIFTITVAAVNDLPVIASQVALSTNEDVAITLQKANFTITDEDNSLAEITISVQAGNNYTFVGNTVTPNGNFNGELTVNLTANDPNSVSEVFHATVTVNAVNDAPVITSTPELTGYVGNLYAYILAASDVDNVTLVKSVVQKPNWMQFSPETGLLTGIPAEADKGPNNLVILRVSDGSIDTDQNFVINVDGPDAIQNLEAAGIIIYPVPAREFLNIELEGQDGETTIDVISLNGTTVAQDIIAPNQAKHVLNLKNLQSGVYFLRIHNHHLNNIGRFTIE